MKFLKEFRNNIVAAIYRQQVLDEIVCTDAEKIHFASKVICNNRCRGHFNHNTEFYFIIKGNFPRT